MHLSRGFISLVMTIGLLSPIVSMAMPPTLVAYEPVMPKRLLSLDMCMDWLVSYHIGPEHVVALSPLWLRYPRPGEHRDWQTHNGSLEQIYKMQPDLVLAGQYNALLLRKRLSALGIKVAVIDLPVSLSEVEQYERRVLTLLGLPVDRATPAPLATALPENAPQLLLLGANGIGTGLGTFENQLIELAGWRNYLESQGYVNLDLEEIARRPPDAIAWSAPASPALANRFKSHPVLQSVVPQEKWLDVDYWRWQCPGPWMWELVEQLKQWHD
jgi:iron complex transport system substrate-binding protein